MEASVTVGLVWWDGPVTPVIMDFMDSLLQDAAVRELLTFLINTVSVLLEYTIYKIACSANVSDECNWPKLKSSSFMPNPFQSFLVPVLLNSNTQYG